MKKAVEAQGIVVMKADKTGTSPDIDQLLVEFGNTATAIPYYAVYRPGKETVHFQGNFLSPSGFMSKAGIDASAGKVELNNVKVEDQSTAKLNQLPTAATGPSG